MKKSLFLILALLFTLAIPSLLRAQDDDTPAITPSTAPYIFDAFAAKPRGDAYIAGIVSQDFKSAPDEFSQWDYFQKLQPVIQRKIKDAKAAGSFRLKVGGDLERYNFDNMSFPTGYDTNAIITLGNLSYSVKFVNVTDFAFIPVPIESARKFQVQLRESRAVTFEVVVTPVGGQFESGGFNVIQARIQSFRILMPDGQVLAEKKL